MGFSEPDEFEVDAGDLFQHAQGLAIIAHPAFGEGEEILRHIDLASPTFRVAHREVIGGTMLVPAHALAAGLAALDEAFNQRGAQDRTQPGELLEEFLAAKRELLGLQAAHVLTLYQCDEKSTKNVLWLAGGSAGYPVRGALPSLAIAKG